MNYCNIIHGIKHKINNTSDRKQKLPRRLPIGKKRRKTPQLQNRRNFDRWAEKSIFLAAQTLPHTRILKNPIFAAFDWKLNQDTYPAVGGEEERSYRSIKIWREIDRKSAKRRPFMGKAEKGPANSRRSSCEECSRVYVYVRENRKI